MIACPNAKQPMRLSRPAILLVERRSSSQFSLRSLLSGGDGVEREEAWVALAPHLDQEQVVTLAELAVLEAVAAGSTIEREELERRFGVDRIAGLVGRGLLLGDDPAHDDLRERAQRLAQAPWWPPAAVVQAFGRWADVDVAADERELGHNSMANLVRRNGPPPVAHPRYCEAAPLPLPPPQAGALDLLLAARATCRNFDDAQAVPVADLATILHRTFGDQAIVEPLPGIELAKKNSPSGGGLHPIEAFVLARRVDGLAAGAYHYLAGEHALEPLGEHRPEDLQAAAYRMVAGQVGFANAQVLVLMAARFERNFWKYRRHPKAWKVIQLDAGHLSQTLLLSATDLGYGAFITAAINDADAEAVFGLDGVSTGAVAVCGLGKRAARIDNVEFDPLGKAVR
jgi:putative peptide maturation dehydrogenase